MVNGKATVVVLPLNKTPGLRANVKDAADELGGALAVPNADADALPDEADALLVAKAFPIWIGGAVNVEWVCGD